MTTLPTSGYLDDNVRDEGEMKDALEDLRDFGAEGPGGAAESELTISSGSITPTGFLHTVDTQADAATDDLTTIGNLVTGKLLMLREENAARVVTVKHGTGNIQTSDGNDVSLADIDGFLMLTRVGTDWVEVCRGLTQDSSVGGTMDSLDGVTPGVSGDVDLVAANGILIDPDDVLKQITLSYPHSIDVDDPHNLTPAQVLNTTALWNLNAIQSEGISAATPNDLDVLKYEAAEEQWKPSLPGGKGKRHMTAYVNPTAGAVIGSEGLKSFAKIGTGTDGRPTLRFEYTTSISGKFTGDLNINGDPDGSPNVNVSFPHTEKFFSDPDQPYFIWIHQILQYEWGFTLQLRHNWNTAFIGSVRQGAPWYGTKLWVTVWE